MQNNNQNWQWRYKEKLISLIVLVILSVAGIWYLADCSCHADYYDRYIFQPYQLIRNKVLGRVFFSIGDIIYLFWGIGLVTLVVKWGYYLIYFKEYGDNFLYSFLKSAVTLASLYFVFMLGWGGNYYKQPVSDYWMLDKKQWNDSSLIQFDRYLVQQLNTTAPRYKAYSFRELTGKAKEAYTERTDCYHNGKGLKIKPSLYGNLLQYMGVQGYYNPFTGEGQVNKEEPAFMLPYIICHEMAHQAGVGAEDDANLLAYTVSVSMNDTSFLYSAYFNVWLYTHIQLKMRDSVAANVIKKGLNPLSLAHLDTLRAIRKKYRSVFGGYTGDIYNQYLKLNNQEDGIESYDKVTVSAWLWEQRRKGPEAAKKIYIP